MDVRIHKRAGKQLQTLPHGVQKTLHALLQDIREKGAVQGAWPNYSKLSTTRHHCKKGKPCYVAVWEVKDNQIRLIEVQYVGTHENAPY